MEYYDGSGVYTRRPSNKNNRIYELKNKTKKTEKGRHFVKKLSSIVFL